MRKTLCILLISLIGLLIAGCGVPTGLTEAEPTSTPTEAIEPAPADTPTPTPLTPTPTPPPPTPIPTAEMAPDLVQLSEWALDLQEQVLQPLEEMAAALEQLLPEGEVPDITTACTGIQVVLDTLVEAQEGVDSVGSPPTDDPDLQECWNEFNAAVDDLQQGLQFVDAWCETGNPASLIQAGAPLQSGTQHLENAAAALERWQTRTGL
jgi:hypothetical protein